MATKPKSKNAPPAAPQVPVGQQSTAGPGFTEDPYGLAGSGIGDLHNAPLRGTYELFGEDPTIYWGDDNGNVTSTVQKPVRNATETILAFTHLSGPQLANIQTQMFRAGYYSSTYTPTYGQLAQEDIAAFRSMIIGVASNPTAYSLPEYLAAAAKAGDDKGVNAKTRAPLVVNLRNDNDLRAVLQAGSQSIFGKFMAEDDVQQFISTYHAQQAGAQTAAYAASGYNPETGQQDINGATAGTGAQGTTVVQPPSTEAGMNLQFAQQMYADHPVTAEMAQFVNNFEGLKAALK